MGSSNRKGSIAHQRSKVPGSENTMHCVRRCPSSLDCDRSTNRPTGEVRKMRRTGLVAEQRDIAPLSLHRVGPDFKAAIARRRRLCRAAHLAPSGRAGASIASVCLCGFLGSGARASDEGEGSAVMAAPSACKSFRSQMRRPSGSVTRSAAHSNGSSSKRLQRRKMDSNNFVDLFTVTYEVVRFSPRKERGS